RLTIPPEPNEYEEEDDEVEPEDERTPLQKSKDAVRDALLAQLASLRDDGEDEAYKKLFQQARSLHAGHLPLLVEWLRFVYGDGPPFDDKQQANRVYAAAEKVIDAIDRDALTKALGVKYDKEDAKDLARQKRANERKAAYVEALTKKARVLLEAGKASKADFEKTWVELRRFVDVKQSKYARFRYEVEIANGFLGKALEIVRDTIKEHPFEKKAYAKRIELYEKLGWDHWAALEKRWLLRRFPPGGYPPF
ncbi:MAG: hypothetical protein QNJ98_09850, partial [Planctomycetota bacterium]|nr:hypothetical protein [Planctomycetota bacterium]